MGRAKAKNKRAFPMTKEPKWTKGPWCYEPIQGLHWISANRRTWVSTIATVPDCDDQNVVANAHLIAAAPELYGSLRNIMDGIETGMITIDSPADEQLAYALRQAKAALSKALGEKT